MFSPWSIGAGATFTIAATLFSAYGMAVVFGLMP